jgi:Sec-independent protein translocase protein TatA
VVQKSARSGSTAGHVVPSVVAAAGVVGSIVVVVVVVVVVAIVLLGDNRAPRNTPTAGGTGVGIRVVGRKSFALRRAMGTVEAGLDTCAAGGTETRRRARALRSLAASGTQHRR